MSESNLTVSKSFSDQTEDQTPEDVATLYSWANLHGAKYRDFSASRAQAREESRLRVEAAAAAERRRQEEEVERIRQEEAQLAARKAAEEAEAARQAEADRLAEIARQAEVERQAVLAAQEAQRQALQQRGWQSPAAEVYQGGYETQFAPVAAAPITGYQAVETAPQFHRFSAESTDTAPSFGIEPAFENSSLYGNEHAMRPFSNPGPVRFARAVESVEPYMSAKPSINRSAEYVVSSQGGYQQHAAGATVPASPRVNQGHPTGYGTQRNYQPSYMNPPQEPYMQSPWQPAEPREEREVRDQSSRPAWLAPEPFAPEHRPSPSAPAPAQRYVPMYAQPVGQHPYPAQSSSQNSDSGQNPNQNPSQNPSPVEDTLVGSRDRMVNRWYALKSVFDPQSEPVEQAPVLPPARVPVLAVFSLAGGVGKTSLVASLGRALSSRGERVLLVDTAVYGLLPFFFGARDQRPGLLRTFNPPGVSLEAPIQLVTLDPDGQLADTQNPDTSQAFVAERNQDWLAQEVTRFSHGANRILIDLPTASGATTRRVLRLAPVVLVPVVPDMNSVVSVGAIEAFFRHSGNIGGKQILPYYVLNQFDYSLPLHLDVREILREQIGDRLLPFALRRSPAVSEALAEGMTVMDYAPGAVVAEDYASLAGWVRSLSAPATQSYRGVRWSER